MTNFHEATIFNLDVGFCGLRGGSIGVGADALAATAGHHRLGQVKPFVCLCGDGVAGVQGFPAARYGRATGAAGLWRADRSFAVFHANALGGVAGSFG